MSKQKNFNEILRSKFIERDIPVDEQNWREMRKTIDASRNRNKRIAWTLSSCAVGLLLLGSYELYTHMNTSKTKTVANTKALPVTENRSSIANNTTSSANASSKEERTVVPPQPIVSARTTAEPVEKSAIASNTSPVQNSMMTPLATVMKNRKTADHINPSIASASTKVNQSASGPAQSKNDEANTSTANNSMAITNPSGGSKSPVNGAVAEGQPKNSDANSETAQANNASLKTPGNPLAEPSIAANNASPQQSESKNNNTNTPAQNTPALASPNNAQPVLASGNNSITPSETSAKNVTGSKTADSSENKLAIVSKSDNNTSKMDSSIATNQQVATLPPLEEEPPINNISIVAGGAYSLGWSYGSTTQGRGITPTLGAEYTRMVNSKWSISAGVLASAISGMGTSPFTINHTTYDFGYHVSDTSLATKWMVYVTAPLQVEYKLDKKNTLGLGATASYLLTGWGTVTVSNNSYSDIKGTSKVYNQFMNVEGYNPWNASVFMVYKRNICGRLSASLMPYFGLLDIKNNSFFKQNTFERDSGIKLLLSYSIL